MPRRLAGTIPILAELLDHRIVDRRRRGDHAPGWKHSMSHRTLLPSRSCRFFVPANQISAVSSAGWKNEESSGNGSGLSDWNLDRINFEYKTIH